MEFIKIKSDKLVIFFLSVMPLALDAGPAVIETFSFFLTAKLPLSLLS